MRNTKLKNAISFLLAVLLTCFSGCATITKNTSSEGSLVAYLTEKQNTLLNCYAPVFVIEKAEKHYNRIGTPKAVVTGTGAEYVYVDSERATIYARTQRFETAKGRYTNLVYRIHFEKVPFSLIPFNLTQGENVGLIVVITLNSKNEPILCTMVHTCGCYVSFVPTSFMPEEQFPYAWEKDRQVVHGENLPGFLDYGQLSFNQCKIIILIKAEIHRVKGIWLSHTPSTEKYRRVQIRVQPLSSLERLPVNGDNSFTSFYESTGSRKDYVKGSHKPWERMLMSWWAFDWRIGEDKKLGRDKKDGIIFYTSLKPWARKASDMRDFVAFLQYWGWKF